MCSPHAESTRKDIVCVYIYTYRHAREKKRKYKFMHSVEAKKKNVLESKPLSSIRLMQVIFRCYSSSLTIH